MAITTNQQIVKSDGWVAVSTNPTALSITANTPGIWYVALTVSGVPDAAAFGERMGDYDSYMTGNITSIVYVRTVSEKGVKFGVTEEA